MPQFDPSRRIEGHGPAGRVDIAFVGEGPGETEHKRGYPFAGASGSELDRYARDGGISRKRCWVTNVVKYWTGPGNPDPDFADLERDLPDLSYELFLKRPTYIAAVGGIATRVFIPGAAMETVHGIAHPVDIGKLFDWGFSHVSIVVPCYHPAAGMHNSTMAALSKDDFAALGRVTRGEAPLEPPQDEYPATTYIRCKGRLELPQEPEMGWHGQIMGTDTEGWPDRPYCLTYSLAPGWAALIMADDKPALKAWEKFVRDNEIQLAIHFAQSDFQIFDALGLDLEGVPVHDTMFMAYEMLEAGQGLKNLCRRYLGMEMEDYDDVTSEYDDKQALAYLAVAARECLILPKPDPVLDLDTKTGKPKVRNPIHIKNRIATAQRARDGKKPKAPRKAWLDVEPEIRFPLESLIGSMPRFGFELVPFPRVLHYACRDADGHRRLAHYYLNVILQDERLKGLYEQDMAVLPMMIEMKRNGMPIDKEKFAALERETITTIARLQKKVNAHNGGYLNVNSRDQVADLLYRRLGLKTKIKTKKTGRPSTNDKALEALKGKHPAALDITECREYTKLKNSFIEVLPAVADRDSRIHPNFKGTRTATGRRAMSDPNLQAIPVRGESGTRLRSCFVAPAGRFLGSADLSQIEMRVMAHLSRDPILIKLITDGLDIHQYTASQLFGVSMEEAMTKQRREPAKRCGFGIITGITGVGLVQQLEMNGVFGYDEEACDEIIADWFKLYRGVWDFIQFCRSSARTKGYAETMWGRRRPLPNLRSPLRWVREEAERDSHSHRIQGSAADLLKRAEARMWHEIVKHPKYWHIKPLLTIHDETVVEGKKGKEKSTGEMMVACLIEDQKMLRVPLEAKYSFGDNWGMLK